jgi:hypothetical protein
MSYLQPAQVLQQLAETLTPEQRDKVIIAGSLAAAPCAVLLLTS